MNEWTTMDDGDLIDVLRRDNRAIERSFRDFELGGLSAELRRELVDHIITELMRHAIAEERYLYPAVRDRLPDGDRIADAELRTHAETEAVLKQLERLDADDRRFDELAHRLFEDVRAQTRHEERHLLPRLRQACPAARLRELGQKISSVKRDALTRPHPAAPDRPPVDVILDPGEGMLDRLRDALSRARH